MPLVGLRLFICIQMYHSVIVSYVHFWKLYWCQYCTINIIIIYSILFYFSASSFWWIKMYIYLYRRQLLYMAKSDRLFYMMTLRSQPSSVVTSWDHNHRTMKHADCIIQLYFIYIIFALGYASKYLHKYVPIRISSRSLFHTENST